VEELADKIIANTKKPKIKILGIMSGSGLLETTLYSIMKKKSINVNVKTTDSYLEVIRPIKNKNILISEKIECLDAVRKYSDHNVLIMAYPRDILPFETITDNLIYRTLALFNLNQPNGLIVVVMPLGKDEFCIKKWFWSNVTIIDKCHEYETPDYFEDGAVICKFDPNCANIKCINKGNKRCSKCKMVYYCSKECQINNWSIHKKSCY
jgi:hypothetical protein